MATFLNLIIGGHYTYAAVEYMDSVSFCGQTCHTVMKPEFTAYQESPHFRVSCTECHIGEGASWFVRSKLSGTRQVFATIFNTYRRPIEQPVQNLRPARETCEHCHWPQRFNPYRLRVIDKYAEDETNTHTQTVLMMKIAGGEGKGVHGFHLAPGVVIQYRSDRSREKIPWVRYTTPIGGIDRIRRRRLGPRQSGRLRAAHDGLRRLPQPPDARLLPGRPRHGPRHGRRQHRPVAAQRQGERPGDHQGRIRLDRGRREQQIPKALEEFYRTEHAETYQAKQRPSKSQRKDCWRSGSATFSRR